jgi:hypothetical protein
LRWNIVAHLLGLYSLTAALIGAAATVTGPEIWIHLRALVGLSSLGLITGIPWGRRVGAVTPSVFLCLASLLGSDPATSSPLWWNFLLADCHMIAPMMLTVLLLVIQCCLQLRGHRMT